jgi:site-specific DNA-methyltransferase (adenine-specific)
MWDGKYAFEKSKIIQGDCLEKMKLIHDGSIDMILTDLPYGTTSCVWDTCINLTTMWGQVNRILKPNGTFITTASQPFTSALVMSNPDMFKYEIIWHKSRKTGHVHAKNKPMKEHENVLVFSKGTTVHKSQSKNRMKYNPQGLIEKDNKVNYRPSREKKGSNVVAGHRPSHKNTLVSEYTNYPTSIQFFNNEHNVNALHETQKPVALFEWIIKTYSNEGDLIVDITAGSGTTGEACINTNRDFILIEKEPNYYEVIKERVGKIFKNYELDLQHLLNERM